MKPILLLILSSVLIAGSVRAEADTPVPALNLLMQHDIRWTRDGVPSSMLALAQTPDGWIWLGGQSGLYRFDGVRFERYTPPSGKLPLSNIFSMGTTASGELWLAYRYGGLSLLRNGKLRNYSSADGLPSGSVGPLAVAGDGRMYVGSGSGLYTRPPDSETWAPLAMPGAPPGHVRGLLIDSTGVMWVQTETAVYSLVPGAAAFTHHGRGGYGEVREAPDGSVWASSAGEAGLRLLRGPREGSAVKWPTLPPGAKFLFDRNGNLWMQQAGGVTFVSRQESDERIFKSSGRQGASGTPQGMLEDREGNIWLVNNTGLERLREKRLTNIKLPHYVAEGRPIAALPDGSVWVDRYRLSSPADAPRPDGPLPSPTDVVSTVHANAAGAIWSGGNGGLFHIVDGKRRQVPVPEGMEGGPIYAIAETPEGLWISIAGGGLYRLAGGKWTHEGGYPELKKFRPTALIPGAAGQLWLGSIASRLALLERGKVTLFGPGQGLLVGTVLAIRPHGKAVWIGGENGVFRYDGKQFTQLAGADDDFPGASGIIFDRDGTMWINGLNGITGIVAGELEQAARRPEHKVRYRRYDNRDGLEGAPAQIAALPSAVAGSDGRLWFSLSTGVYTFAPGQLARNPLAPPVYITSLSAGGKGYGTDGAPELPPGTANVRIEYTALSMVAPDRMQFRYRLAGVDKDWQQAGARRAVSYSNLEPGRYSFQVAASNNDGVWNDTGASITFSIAPTLLQTLWFRVLCAMALLAAAWLLHRWRLRRQAKQILARLEERLGERERIARELHDTLLQSVQGLLLRVQGATMLLPATDKAHSLLTTAMERASSAMEEARDRVRALRSHSAAPPDLAEAIREAGQEFGGALPVSVSQSGRAQELHPVAREELLAIGREALLNAVRHCGGTEVQVELHYRHDELQLLVSDNGRGIDPAILQAGQREGHWGLASIRERAHKIGAKVQVDSSAEGTAWRITLPAALAYVPATRQRVQAMSG